MIIAVIGPSGSGKGTQAKLLADKFGIETISTGDLLRYEIENKTDIGIKVSTYVRQGAWPPDFLVVEPLREKLSKLDMDKGFILDGFPRTGNQVGILDSLLGEFGQSLDAVIHFYLPTETILDRMRKQRGEDEDRPDTQDEAIKHRLQSYIDTIYPVAQQYLRRGILVSVDARPSKEEIFIDIVRQLEDISKI